jgi:hypothetical protein
MLFENNYVFPKGDNKNLSQNIIIMQFTYVWQSVMIGDGEKTVYIQPFQL